MALLRSGARIGLDSIGMSSDLAADMTDEDDDAMASDDSGCGVTPTKPGAEIATCSAKPEPNILKPEPHIMHAFRRRYVSFAL